MKKRLLLLLAGVLLLAGSAFARPVDANKARTVAETYLRAMGMKNTAGLVDVTAQTSFTEFYIFASEAGGFILVSADDCARPVLGYSLTTKFETKDIPEHVQAWLEDYEREIRYGKLLEARRGNLGMANAVNPLANQWQMLEGGEMPPAPLTTAIAPLMTTSWGQRPLYNDLCPFDSVANNRVPTGCVATATAQVMKYHNYPTTGYGSHSYTSQRTIGGTTYIYGPLSAIFDTTYQWGNMPNSLTSTSSNDQIGAVATLMYHIGVANEMMYSPNASGSWNQTNDDFRPSTQTSLMSYFKYRPDMSLLGRDDFPNDDFCARLRAELDQNRPILYSGSDYAGGHSFVLHGYDNNGLFCVNWGWKGLDDGYYAIGALNPGEGGDGGNATYTFNSDNIALIGIRPNNSWSTTATTTVNVINNASGNNSISGSGTYSFGDTVTMKASAVEGYRFAGWSDGDRSNPRRLIANGGTYSFTGNFAQMQGDTLGYCNPYCQCLTRYSVYNYDGRWGIRLPASMLPVGHHLTSAELYVGEVGTYTLQVYTGTTSPTTLSASSQAVYIDSTGMGQWHTFTLNTPLAVDSTQNLWITFYCPDAGWPATVTNWSGRYDGFCMGDNMTRYSNKCSFMIRGIFSNPVETDGDTVSYCGNNEPYDSGIGTSSGGNWQWGIMLPPSAMGSANYLKSVMLYVLNEFPGTYTLKIYRGGDTIPTSLAHTQVVSFASGQSGWQEVSLDALFPLDNQNLWITFSTSGLTYPMSICDHSGSPNSDWLNNGGTWIHLHDINLEYSWLIKAVTSATAPLPVAPTVSVSGQFQIAMGLPYSYTATGTPGTAISWTLPGATPTTATGSTVTATWNTPGYHNVIANITNAYGTGADTMLILVVDYSAGDTVSYSLDRPHYSQVGGVPFSWGIMIPAAFMAHRNLLNAVQVGVNVPGTYPLRIYQGGDAAPQTLLATYSVNVSAADTLLDYATFSLPTPLPLNNSQSLWIVFSHNISTGFPIRTCWRTTDPNSDWISLNDTNWYHLPQVNVPNDSWLIKAITSQSSVSPTQYTITAASNNPTMGTVTGGGVYNAGSTATLTAVANSGYHFVSWQDGDTNTPRIITVTGDSTFTATFAADAAPVQQYTITVSSNNPMMGTVTGGGTYNAGATITLTATANNGYHFVDWNDSNTTNPRMVTVTANATYTANFAADTPNPPTGDTISYCLDNPIATSINAGGASFDWGIMFPASILTGRNYLKSVLTYVLSDETYTLRVFRGGDNMPATLVHTQSVAFDTNHLGWQEIVLDATVPLPTGQNLWVVINSTVAAVCNYTGDVNSDWLGFSDTNWIHLYEANASLTFSWLLKAVTSTTQPALPAPSVTISGPSQIALGAAATFEAAGTTGAVITWNFQGGAPAVATGTSATTTFTTPGLHNVVATITNAYGTGRDTLQVLVVDYAVGDTVSYCLDREFFTNIGTGSPAPFSWGIMLPAAYLVHRDKLDHVLLYTKVPGDYTLHLYQGGDTVPQNLIHTQVFNITDTNSGYKTLTPNTTINIDKTQNLWIVFHTDSLSYAAAAGAYADDINSSWITLNDTNWNQLADYGLVYSWLIKVVTSQEGPVTHNVTVVSIMNDGTELDPAVCTVTGADAYAEGSTVTLTAASSDPTIKFLFWITSSGDTILDNPYIFPIHSDVTLIAVFDHTEGISGIRNERCNIYPNPAHDFVVIDGVEGQGQVTITDITGRQVARFEVRNGRTEFDVSRLGTGQYFVRIVADGFNTMKKLIVE